MSDADLSPDPETEDRPTARDHPKGYASCQRQSEHSSLSLPSCTNAKVGFIYEDVFKELYTGTSTASANPAEEKEDEADAGARLGTAGKLVYTTDDRHIKA